MQRSFLVAGFAMLLWLGQARAGVIASLTQVGPNVVLSASGTIDLTGAAFSFTTEFEPNLTPVDAEFIVGAVGQMSVYIIGVSGSSLGSGGSTVNATSGLGDIFGITVNGGGSIGVPQGYVSGNPLSGSATFAGHTFASLGVTPGTYIYTLANQDTFRLTIGDVPEPSSFLLLGGGLVLGWLRLRRA